MIKAAIEKILEISSADKGLVERLDGTYTKDNLTRIKASNQKQPEALVFHTLSGLVEFIDSQSNGAGYNLIDLSSAAVQVSDYKSVRLIGPIQSDNDNERFSFAKAILDVDGFKFGTWFDLEMFVIALQSQFVVSKEIEKILQVIGNLASERVRTQKDSGFTQSVQVKVGITLKSEVEIKNPIVLRPWRTFREAVQPTSACVLRLRESKEGIECALWESDGGAWRLEAVKAVAEWIKANLASSIKIYA
ncbi:MAG: hypothetical protein M0036_20785 [Desulfobacteraceae bacterium]|nr:hypothetical protein [Desulfobacteraceae bacterium]